MKEQFRSGTPGCQRVTSLKERFLQHPGTSSVHIEHWSGLLCTRRCLHDHPRQKLESEKRCSTHRNQVKTIVREIMKVESSKQFRALSCCSMTIDSKSHLVAPAVSTEYPVIQEDAHRRLSQEEQRAFDLASEEERETARISGVSLARGTLVILILEE